MDLQILTRLRPWMDWLWDVFSPRTQDHMLTLLAGAILTPGCRTVAAALRVVGLGQTPQFTTYHRLLNRNAWSSRELARRLLRLLVSRLVPRGPIVVGLDDTLERSGFVLTRHRRRRACSHPSANMEPLPYGIDQLIDAMARPPIASTIGCYWSPRRHLKATLWNHHRDYGVLSKTNTERKENGREIVGDLFGLDNKHPAPRQSRACVPERGRSAPVRGGYAERLCPTAGISRTLRL